MIERPLLIGSAAHSPHEGIVCPADFDFIGTTESIGKLFKTTIFSGDKVKERYPTSGNHIVQRYKDGVILEAEYAFKDSSAEAILEWAHDARAQRYQDYYYIAHPELCWMLKESHKYKPSVHFEKTRRDVIAYRRNNKCKGLLDSEAFFMKKGLFDILKQREEETYRAPVKLKVSKDEFFSDDGVPYIIDHDLIHEIVALGTKPAYTHILKDGEAVYCDKELWDDVSEGIKQNCVVEEAMAIALERAVIPFDLLGKVDDEKSARIFKRALQCICTDLCSGWFREYAWENYDKILSRFHTIEQNSFKNFCQRFDLIYKINNIK